MSDGERAGSLTASGAQSLGLALPPGAQTRFAAYYDLLDESGKDVNLTAISGAERVARLHFLDSLALLKVHEFKGLRVIDVGSGAGFPGVPIKLAEPSVTLTLLDATGKRVAFLSELCGKLEVEAACVHARAEDAARLTEHRECYDAALSRGLAKLSVLCELCLPFVRVGGVFIAMKSIDSADETEASQNAIAVLGAALQECVDYEIPESGVTHRAVLIRKTAVTPDKYPRRFARIKNSPL